MTDSPSRRTALARLAAGGVAPFFIPHLLTAAPSRAVRLASFGGDGMAYVTLRELARQEGAKLVAVAEIDNNKLAQLKENFGESVRVYQDWREMLRKERSEVDCVCVGTPDHMHAAQTMAAMQLGLHAYTQKPLTHDIYETRRLTEFAKKKRLVTQMGIQVHSQTPYRTAVALVQSGAVGKIKEVHSWSSKKWGDPDPKPDRSDPVPAGFNWDQWLGMASPRPYIGDGYYHPVNWRKRLDFGTGTFGDMGCHIFDPVFESLALTAPVSVRSEGNSPANGNWCIDCIVKYTFPGTKFTDGEKIGITWYDGDAKPSADVQQLVEGKITDQGSIFIGTKGVILLPHIGMPQLFPSAQFRDFKIERVEGTNHYKQFIEAVGGNGKTLAPFEYAGPLTEAVLLGGVATRFRNTTLEWDAAHLRFRNEPAANALVRRRYRAGWKVAGL